MDFWFLVRALGQWESVNKRGARPLLFAGRVSWGHVQYLLLTVLVCVMLLFIVLSLRYVGR